MSNVEAQLEEPRASRPRPPLIGTPPPPVKERPKCPGCDRPLRPYLKNHWEKEPDGTMQLGAVAREWDGTYHGFGEFCGTMCAARFANRVVRILYPALSPSVLPKIREQLIRRPE